MNEIVMAYIPVLDKGYTDFLLRHRDARVFIFGEDLILEFESLRKDLRRLDTDKVIRALEALGMQHVSILSQQRLSDFQGLNGSVRILMPDEDICREMAEKYLPGREIAFKFLGLRYDRKKTLEKKEVVPDSEISSDDFAVKILNFLDSEAKKSVDWWRQIGAALVKDGKVVFWAINQPTPDEYALLHMGDPRSNFKRGQFVEFSNVLHAEAAIVAKAARTEVSMEGADFFTTTLPCPPCSRVLAYTGIKRLFFLEGYAMLDGDEILRSQNIRIIKVEKSPCH